MVKRHNKAVTQLLVQWSNLGAESATCEDYTVLKSQFPDFDPWGQGSTAAAGIVMATGSELGISRKKRESEGTFGGNRFERRLNSGSKSPSTAEKNGTISRMEGQLGARVGKDGESDGSRADQEEMQNGLVTDGPIEDGIEFMPKEPIDNERG
ncbi:hypothetical protein HRI_000673700 [Hibiscus trionum]|uniref:Uncharacterized protein n=1 Tax=Hibiscus trionum TaxID=183268 RepID=A0A9W7H2S9_HIBTR|nr:hypothetical protein HRI_000673700 [Hibiscus trionum]